MTHRSRFGRLRHTKSLQIAGASPHDLRPSKPWVACSSHAGGIVGSAETARAPSGKVLQTIADAATVGVSSEVASAMSETLEQMAFRVRNEVFSLREEEVAGYFSNLGIPAHAFDALGITDDAVLAALGAGVVIGVEWERCRIAPSEAERDGGQA